jgi:signal transduction histidine kinase
MGLTNISNRASLFDGKADIDTQPGKGCTVTVTIPFSGIRRD